jgi:TetR/AcrR family transcriptional regulator
MTEHGGESPRPRKEEIVDVAMGLFAEHGYEGTSMNNVAERVGIRKASLFYHFASKDALYEAVLDRLISHVAMPLGAAYSSAGTFAERLDTAADAVTSVLGERPFAARLLVREAMDWGPIMRSKILGHVVLVLEGGAAFVKAGQEAGAFVEGDPKQIVLTALGAHFLPFALGHLVEKYVGMDPFDPSFVAQRRVALRAQVRNMIVRERA